MLIHNWIYFNEIWYILTHFERDARDPGKARVFLMMEYDCKLVPDFNFSVGCFGTDIIQKCTKWSQIGVHGLKIGQIFANFNARLFWFEKMWKQNDMVEKKHKHVIFCETTSLRSYTGHTKIGKTNLPDIIELDLINLVKCN